MPSNPLRIRDRLFRRPSRPSRIKSRRYRISSMIEVCLTPSSSPSRPMQGEWLGHQGRSRGRRSRSDQKAKDIDQIRICRSDQKMSIRSEDIDQIRRCRSDQKMSIRSEDVDQIRRCRSDQKMSIRSEDGRAVNAPKPAGPLKPRRALKPTGK